jgi:hypothetical protein
MGFRMALLTLAMASAFLWRDTWVHDSVQPLPVGLVFVVSG